MSAPQCEVWTLRVLGIEVLDPFIVPTSLAAAAIGITCGLRLWRRGLRAEALPEFLFAWMMTTAMIAHCFSAALMNSLGQLVFWFIDAALTSTVALAFGFLGLQDAGILKNDLNFYGYLLLADLPVIGGWYYAFFVDYSPAVQAIAFKYLYLILILVTCGFFGLVQLWFLVEGRFAHGLVPLLIACASGVAGIKSITWCSWPDVRFSGEVWWFLFSDISMLFLFLYFIRRQVKQDQ